MVEHLRWKIHINEMSYIRRLRLASIELGLLLQQLHYIIFRTF